MDILSASAERADDGDLAYRIRGNWTATGTVGHWGHIHERRNEYPATLTHEPIDGAWKLVDVEILDEVRL